MSMSTFGYILSSVEVRPNRIELSGVGEHVIQGNRVVLQCVVRGARPAANVTWYNGTVQLQESSSAESLQDAVSGN
uniref:Ig-like domain-containing protein n=1 Tax=Rhodnius prolixus TaxID=13249 RepID=T1HZR8_RHOPR